MYQVKIATLGGMERVLDAMRLHPGDMHVQRQALFALMTIADHVPDTQATVVQPGGIELILSAVTAHMSWRHVMEYGCWALMVLAENHQPFQTRILEAHGVDCILMALDTYTLGHFTATFWHRRS